MQLVPIQFKFKAVPFFILLLFALIVLASWIYPESRVLWDKLDKWTFLLLNGSLSSNDTGAAWNMLWAVTNSRIVDLLTLFIMVSFLLVDGVTFRQNQAFLGLVGFILLLVLWVFLRETLLDSLVNTMDWSRPSPSRQIESAVRLSKLFPILSPKDATAHGFPGDHAAVLFLWLSYSLYFIRNRWSFCIGIIVVFLTLPRLVSGAHWLTDILVGSTVITCMVLALGLYTPLLNFPLKIATIIIEKFLLLVSLYKKN